MKSTRERLRQPTTHLIIGFATMYVLLVVRFASEIARAAKRPNFPRPHPGLKAHRGHHSSWEQKQPMRHSVGQMLKNTGLTRIQDKAFKPRMGSMDSAGKPKCFKQAMVNNTKSCLACVNFITIAKLGSRWSSSSTAQDALRVVTRSLRLNHRCFKLHLYTDVKEGSEMERKLKLVGGDDVQLHQYPNDLPRNAYSGRNAWLELSRRKLDVVSRHMKKYGHKVIWTDLDTLILTDLSCAYSKLQNFVVSRDWPGEHYMRGPGNVGVRVRHGYSVYGDFWMADNALIDRVLDLEKRGMPPPSFDLQDYFAYMLNLCDGSLTDLRGYLTDDKDKPQCLGFDYSNGHHPYTQNIYPMRVINDTLYCSVERDSRLVQYRMASMSFIYPLFVKYIQNPRVLFNNKELLEWAHKYGFVGNRYK